MNDAELVELMRVHAETEPKYSGLSRDFTAAADRIEALSKENAALRKVAVSIENHAQRSAAIREHGDRIRAEVGLAMKTGVVPIVDARSTGDH